MLGGRQAIAVDAGSASSATPNETGKRRPLLDEGRLSPETAQRKWLVSVSHQGEVVTDIGQNTTFRINTDI
jgi:hypothetical protein